MNLLRTFLKRVSHLSQLSLAVLVLTSAALAAGELDPTFNVAVQDTTSSGFLMRGSVHTIVTQSNGKFLVGGNFTVAGNAARSSVARFNADGTADSTFDPPDFYTYDANFILNPEEVYIYAVAVQPDGKVLVGGNFINVGGQGYRGIVRLNANGTIDTSFYAPVVSTASPNDSTVYKIKVTANNQIVIGGKFTLLSQQQGAADRINIARLNQDGSADLSFSQIFTFSSGVSGLAVQADGKVLYATDTIVRRANSDGTIDSTFTENQATGGGGGNNIGQVRQIVIQPDGRILIAGSFSSINGASRNYLARIMSDGSLDPSLTGSGATGYLNDVAVANDGRIIVGGAFSLFNGVPRWSFALLNPDGSLYSPFQYAQFNPGIVNAVAVFSDGRVLAGGRDFQLPLNNLARINLDGSLDTAFAGDTYRKGTVFKTAVQPDGKVLIAGIFGKVNGVVRQSFARLNADGSLDPVFVANTGAIAQSGTAIALQSDGKVIIAGVFQTINGVTRRYLARLNSNANLDAGFNPPLSNLASTIDEIVVLADGKVLIAGNIRLANGELRSVVRLNGDGSLDTTFATVTAAPVSPVVPVVRALEVQTDGKIMIGGQFNQINQSPRGRIARLNADGTLDTTFNPPSGANSDVVDLAVQSNGSVVIGGEFTTINGNAEYKHFARLLPDGNLDTSFAGRATNPIYAVERDANDKILYGGIFGINNFVRRFGVARLNPNGSPDNSFTEVASNDAVLSILIQNDNKLLIAGEFSRVNGISTIGVARINNARSPALYDFDGDGRADISVFRPSNGTWYRLNSSNNSFSAEQFGQAGDKPAPADYDGDGRTDIAVFREGAFGYFYILNSADNTFRFAQFGRTGDEPVAGDWDGDGKADLAVYRGDNTIGSQSQFYYRPTSAPNESYRTITNGTGGRPVVGDFDGDGKIDAALFLPTGVWSILRSSDNQITQTAFGSQSDIPVAADYDGDGKANIAVFRPSNGTWYTSQSPANNYGAILFGASGDLPVPADYDGDGRADVAVFRPSAGAWYLQRTTSGFTGVQFGATNDTPIPNAYIR